MKNNFIINLFYGIFNKLNYLTVFISYFVVSLVLPEIDSSLQHFYSNNHMFIIYCCIVTIFIRITLSKEFRNNVVIDLKIQFLLLKLKNFWKFINFFKINFQKIFLYLIDYKFYKNLNVIKFLVFKLIDFNLLWRPLFKRFSYFGNYKNSRSKFIKYKNN